MRFLATISLFLALTFPLFAQTKEGSSLLLTGLELAKSGNLAGAVTSLKAEAASQQSLLSDYAQFAIGDTYFSAKEYASAAVEFQKLITDYPNSILCSKAALMEGKSFLALKKYFSAIEVFSQLLENYPDAGEAAEARFLIGRAYQADKKWQAAYLAFEETDLYFPLNYFGRQARLEAKKLKRTYKKKLPSFKASAAALFNKGMTYFDQDDYEMAANTFSRLAREYPKSQYINEAILMLGRAEMQTSKYESAISDLTQATQGPANLAGQAHFYLGLAYGRRGLYDKAIASMKVVTTRYPDSGLAPEATYWCAYYYEINDQTAQALLEYYNLINKYPYSQSVPAAIWRIGRVYYWNAEFKNAATYLHLAQLYPPGEDTPRCYYFEAKALERLGNRPAALDIYKKLTERFDHTYYAYRAKEKLNGFGITALNSSPFDDQDFSAALHNLGEKNQDELAAIMEIWEQVNTESLQSESSEEARVHLEKYKELMSLGLTSYAKDEARFLVNITSDREKDSLQTKLGEVLINSGNYRTPIKFADRKVKAAVLSGKTQNISNKIWRLAYPKGYWKYVAKKSASSGLDPYLALAVIREESRFNPKAISRSSARGLMQIMPKTGRGIAKDLSLSRYRTKKLFEPATNIQMGTYYLSCLIKNFSNNYYLALAGYNGGPNKIKRYVKSWYNGDLGTVDIDEFVESLPSRETRLYVQKVMNSYFEYKRLYERKG